MDKDTLYSRWLTGSLTDEEISAMKKSGEWAILEKIISETDRWSLPELTKDSYAHVREELSRKNDARGRVIPINRKAMYSIAASLAFIAIAALWFLRPQTVTYQCVAGQMLKVTLPDSTVVQLSGQSSIAFEADDFANGKRNVTLTGQAYFDVRQKGAFSVKFKSGMVNVLGTRFDIMAGETMAVVKCFEGTVEVSHDKLRSQVLNKGAAVRIDQEGKGIEKLTIASEDPDWLAGESVFKDAPLKEIMSTMGIQYNVIFDATAIDADRRYSGKFPHADLEKALQMVFQPMGIAYVFSGDQPVKITLEPAGNP